MLLIAAAYIAILHYCFGADLWAQWEIWPNTAGIVVLVYLLGYAVFLRSDRSGLVPLSVLAGMLAVILTSTVAWPVLVYTGFFKRNVLYVNVIGKWLYLIAVLITLVGLCVLAVRVIRASYASRIRYLRARQARRRMYRAACAAVIVVTLAATVPALIGQSQIRDPHAAGLVTPSLVFNSGLYRALPQLLNWLLLALAIAVLLTISRRASVRRMPTYRAAVRCLAIPVMLLILFGAYNYAHNPWIISSYTWLYLPVTPVAGLVILTWLVLPAKLTTAEGTLAPGKACTRLGDRIFPSAHTWPKRA